MRCEIPHRCVRRKYRIRRHSPFRLRNCWEGRSVRASSLLRQLAKGGCAARRLSWVTPGFSQSRRCKTTASEFLQELVQKCSEVGLEINTGKTKVLRNRFADPSKVYFGSPSPTTQLDDVDEYIYLGRQINAQNNLMPEIHRRRRAAWAAFNGIKNATDSITDKKIRANLFDSIVLPALTYVSEAWTFTKALSERVRITHASPTNY